MEWWAIVLVIAAIPIIVFPVTFIWYMNVSGLYTVIREALKKRVTRRRRIRAVQTDRAVVAREAR